MRSALLLVVLVFAGCASGPPLLDERTAEPFASLLEQRAPYARTVERVEAGETEGLKVQVTHVASPTPEGPTIVLVNGVLSAASVTFRFLEGPLGAKHDLLLVDLPGCGGSDKPEFTRMSRDAYTHPWIAAHVFRAVDRWMEAHQRDDRLVFVGHSIGGGALLRGLADPSVREVAPRVADQVERLVLISPPDVDITASEKFELLSGVNQPLVDVLCALGLAKPLLEDGIRGTVVEPREHALRQEVMNFGQAVLCCDWRRGSKAMLYRYHPRRPDGSIDEDEIERQKALQRQLELPCLVIVGSHDEAVPATNGATIAERLPNATLVCLRAKHSPHQERAVEVGEAIRAFVAGDAVEPKPCPQGRR